MARAELLGELLGGAGLRQGHDAQGEGNTGLVGLKYSWGSYWEEWGYASVMMYKVRVLQDYGG